MTNEEKVSDPIWMRETSQTFILTKLYAYINETPELLSLLYDLDLLPEQLEPASRDQRRMAILTVWHMNKHFPDRTAGLVQPHAPADLRNQEPHVSLRGKEQAGSSDHPATLTPPAVNAAGNTQ